MPQNSEKYITLKEASQISGYAPDYVGQLIRKGKIPGKQIVAQTAWVTTEEAIHIYMSEGKKKDKGESTLGSFKNTLATQFEFARLYTPLLYTIIILTSLFSLLLFFLLSVSVDKYLEKRALEQAQYSL